MKSDTEKENQQKAHKIVHMEKIKKGDTSEVVFKATSELDPEPLKSGYSSWKEFLLCKSSKLNCKVCLGDGGQSFTWESLNPNTWYNVINGFCVIIRQDDSDEMIKLYLPSDLDQDEQTFAHESVLDYLRLTTDLEELCEEWSCVDPKFPKHLTGIRLLRQDPIETLFAFICSQNNLISRIKQLVKTLKKEYGSFNGSYSFETYAKVDFYSFPKDLSVFIGSEAALREWKFGYRAKYISSAATFLSSNEYRNSSDLCKFRCKSYEETVKFLRQVPGIGPKVADCVALMSLDQLASVPIDTHIWRIARERYKFSSSVKTVNLNDRIYKEIGDKFRELFGDKAGWAHSVLFTAELRPFKAQKK